MFPALEDIETEKLVDELRRREFRITAPMPRAIEVALKIVQAYHPEVRGVHYSGDIWLFVDKDRKPPETFMVPNHLTPVLEDALDAAYDINDGWCEFFLPLN